MPEILEDVEEKAPVKDNPQENELISALFELTHSRRNPWRDAYLNELVECYNFKELKQWSGEDMSKAGELGVPLLPIDRTNRGLDTVRGIRDNTGNKKKFQKRSGGDDRIAQIFDKTAESVSYNGNFDEVRGETFDAMLDCGMGIRKSGFDPQGNGGAGEYWAEFVPTEEMYWAKCKSKTLRDARWIAQHTVMDWEDAILIAPDKASEIKSLKATTTSEYEKKKLNAPMSGVSVASLDYGVNTFTSDAGNISYPDQVDVWEFWIERRIPRKKVAYPELQLGPDGYTPIPTMAVRVEASEYEPQEGEQVVASFIERYYEQFVVVGNESSGIVVGHAKDDEHPFVGMCAEWTKQGKPVGYIHKVIPHQKRINLAWAQKIAYNNMAIKSPLVIEGTIDLQSVTKQTAFGAVLNFPMGTARIHSLNQQPQVNLQAIEEGNMARADMDFAAAATEGSLRGNVTSSTSGIALAQQQNASITPINRWVNAEKLSELEFNRRVLRMLIKYWGDKPQLLARVIGEEEFMKLAGPQVDPATQQMVAGPLEWPAQIDIAQYDVVVEDQSTSDFNKQQTFNAVMAMRGDGVLFTDEAMIKNAPVKNTQELIMDNEKARQDVLRMLMQQNAMLSAQLGMMEKQIPKANNQNANAIKGKSAPQVRQSMPGGTSPQSVLG